VSTGGGMLFGEDRGRHADNSGTERNRLLKTAKPGLGPIVRVQRGGRRGAHR